MPAGHLTLPRVVTVLPNHLDTFTDANGTGFLSHNNAGVIDITGDFGTSPYTVNLIANGGNQEGTPYQIQNNVLTLPNANWIGGDEHVAFLWSFDGNNPDNYDWRIDFRWSVDLDQRGLMIGRSNDSNFWYAQARASVFKIVSVEAGVHNIRAQTPLTSFDVTQWHTIRFKKVGSFREAWLNESNYISTNYSFNDGRSSWGVYARYDNQGADINATDNWTVYSV